MKYEFYQVDAFTSEVFGGNPGGVVVLPSTEWPADQVLQRIATENSVPATGFYTRPGPDGVYGMRWFTPVREVELCGHASLATSKVAFLRGDHTGSVDEIVFQTKFKGQIKVTRKQDGKLELDFPETQYVHLEGNDVPEQLLPGLGIDAAQVKAVLQDMDTVVVVDDDAIVESLTPDISVLKSIKTRCIVVTAPSKSPEFDIRTRVFGVGVGVDEDPVTGSTHTLIGPYWSQKLGKTELRAKQGDDKTRVGELTVVVKKSQSRVALIGDAAVYLKGEIYV